MTHSIDDLIPKYLKESTILNVNATDMTGNFIYVNESFQERFSFITDDFMGFYSMKTIYQKDHDACIEAVERCFANPNTPARVKLRKPLDGYDKYEWTDWEFSPLFDAEGQPLGVLCVGYAITEQQILIKKLRNSNIMLEKVAQSQAHQLRGPITSLQMILTMLKNNKDVVNEKDLDLLSKALVNVDESIKAIINITVKDKQNVLKKHG